MSIEFITKSPIETFGFGRKVAAKEIKELLTIKLYFLSGELGSGKTTFVKGFCSFWEIHELVSSPSYTILNEYCNEKIKISHLDLYRIKNVNELEDLDLVEIFDASDYVFVEWPEKIIDIINNSFCNISFFYGGEELERIIKLEINL